MGIANPFANVKGINSMSRKELGKAIGLTPSMVTATKSADRALTPETARKLAALTEGEEKPANLFAVTQVAALKSKIRREEITPAGVGRGVGRISATLKGEFHRGEFDRSDPELAKALDELKTIASNVLDLLDGDEDDKPAVATKSAAAGGGIQRDMLGRNMGKREAPAVAMKASTAPERDFFGRRMNR
jgi:plasmid maintenance system antidote protein VapI